VNSPSLSQPKAADLADAELPPFACSHHLDNLVEVVESAGVLEVVRAAGDRPADAVIGPGQRAAEIGGDVRLRLRS